MNPLPLVRASLSRNARGAVAIVALVALATALGIVVSAEERAVRAAATRAADRFDLIVGAPGSTTQLLLTTVYLQPAPLELLPAETLARLQHDPRVASAAPVAVTDSYRGHMIVGTSPSFAGVAGLAAGRMPAGPHEALAGADVDLPLGQAFAPMHGSAAENLLEPHPHRFTLTVVGRLRANGGPWDRAIVVPIEAVWAMHDGTDGADHGADAANAPARPSSGIGRVPAVVVKPRSIGDAYTLRADWRGPATTAFFPAEVLLPLYRLLGDARDLATTLAVASEVLLLFAVLLAVVTALAARRGGIGALRALGAPPRFVFAAVWLEVAVLIVAGVAAGAALGAVAVHWIGAIVSEQTGLAVDATLGTHEGVLLLAIALGGTLLGTVPSLLALRGSVADLLRHA